MKKSELEKIKRAWDNATEIQADFDLSDEEIIEILPIIKKRINSIVEDLASTFD